VYTTTSAGFLRQEMREEDAIYCKIEDVIFSQYYTLEVGGLTLQVENSHLLYHHLHSSHLVPGSLDKNGKIRCNFVKDCFFFLSNEPGTGYMGHFTLTLHLFIQASQLKFVPFSQNIGIMFCTDNVLLFI
jgi:hypothetical protein